MRTSRFTSASSGTFFRVSRSRVSREAIISGRAAFLAPEIGIVPWSLLPPTMRIRSMKPREQRARVNFGTHHLGRSLRRIRGYVRPACHFLRSCGRADTPPALAICAPAPGLCAGRGFRAEPRRGDRSRLAPLEEPQRKAYLSLAESSRWIGHSRLATPLDGASKLAVAMNSLP